MDKAIHFVTFLTVLGCSLLLLKVTWFLIFINEFPTGACQCLCADDRVQMADLDIRILYRGQRANDSSCGCESFLLPQISKALRIEVINSSEICFGCECGVYKPKQGGFYDFESYLTVVVVTMLMTALIYLLLVMLYKCSNEYSEKPDHVKKEGAFYRYKGKLIGFLCVRNKQKRQGYEPIGETFAY